MGSQALGTDRGFITVIQGGPRHRLNEFTQIRKVKTGVTVYPGRFVSGSGETEGEIDLAASGDEFAANVEIVLEQVGYTDRYKPDIDSGITAGEFCLTLRPTGGLFKVAAWRADESNNTELGEPMVLEADGMLKKWAYADGTQETDVAAPQGGFVRCAEVTTDVAGTDLIQCVWF